MKGFFEILCPWKPYRLWTDEDKRNAQLLYVVALGVLLSMWM